MMRNDQNSTGTLGMVLSAAAAISARVAFSISGAIAFQQQRVAQIVDMGVELLRARGVVADAA